MFKYPSQLWAIASRPGSALGSGVGKLCDSKCSLVVRLEVSFASYREHITLMASFECFRPKHHGVWHMLRNQSLHGNPSRYSNWRDESLNKVLKDSCRNLSQLTFERVLLLKMRATLSRESAKRHRDV